MKRIFALLSIIAASIAASGQSSLKFDTTVHDFGQVLISDGPVSCSFTATNTGSEPVVLQSVSTSCGCTDVKWKHDPVAPGGKMSISVKYTNDEGPYPFDKVITVKVLGSAKPILLHIRGISQDKIKSDREIYTTVFGGSLGMISAELKSPNLEQGTSRSDQCTVANLSGKAIKVAFSGVSEGLSVEVKPNPIPAGGHATLTYTVSALKSLWGLNKYAATPVIDGKDSGKSLTVSAFTTENFSSMTKEQKAAGSRPIFPQSSFTMNHRKQGAVVEATFTCRNDGKAPLVIHKLDADRKVELVGTLPRIEPGKSATIKVRLDTSDMPKGEALATITLTTNSPIRPIVNLFIAGWID